MEERIGFECLAHARAILTALHTPFSLDEVVELARRLAELGGDQSRRRPRKA